MKHLILFLLFALPASLMGQASECIMSVTEYPSGDNVLVGMDEVKYVVPVDTGCLIMRGNRLERYHVSESLDSLIVYSSGELFKFTNSATGANLAVAKNYVSEIRETRSGKAAIVTKDIRSSFIAEETFAAIRPLATICSSGSGGGGTYVGQNVGTGEGSVYKTTTGSIHEFRKILAGSNMTVTQSGDDIRLDAAAGSVTVDDVTIEENVSGDLQVKDSGINSAKIANGSVTFTDIQNISSGILLGRSTAGGGSAEEISLGAGLTLNSGTLSASGGGGSGGVFRYDAGNGVWVSASNTGVTATKSGGTATVTVPSGVELVSVRVNGTSSDLDGSNNFNVVLDHDSGVTYNQSVATMYPPTIDIFNTASQLGGGPTTSLPFVQDEGSSPQPQIVAVANGDITARIINLDAFSNWTVLLQL